MIQIRHTRTGQTTQIDVDALEGAITRGEIGANDEICFPAVTGDQFVRAGDLELFAHLRDRPELRLTHYFNLRKAPTLTLSVIAALCGVYFFWQRGAPVSIDAMSAAGAKNIVFVRELGQWWRLLTANLIHASALHLFLNAFFLFNLGGPVEAIYRRIDYALILGASALGTTILSGIANPLTSCGASGIVFGAWGAAASFGLRHRALLPARYRRYFLGSVVPYSVFALYMGLAVEGIDNWGHLGGLIGGTLTSLALTPRLLSDEPPRYARKLSLMGAVAVALAVVGPFTTRPIPISHYRYLPQGGLGMAVPKRWNVLVSAHRDGIESHAFTNGAGVTIALQTERESRPVDLDHAARDFVENDLGAQLEAGNVAGVRIDETTSTKIGHLDAVQIDATLLVDRDVTRARYIVAARGHYRYVVNATTPVWLWPKYERLAHRVVDSTRIIDPTALKDARQRYEKDPTDMRAALLALARYRAGDLEGAMDLIGTARREGARQGMLDLAEVTIRLEQGESTPQMCDMALRAIAHVSWSPESLEVVHTAHLACGRRDLAARIAKAATTRFPTHVALHARMERLERAYARDDPWHGAHEAPP